MDKEWPTRCHGSAVTTMTQITGAVIMIESNSTRPGAPNKSAEQHAGRPSAATDALHSKPAKPYPHFPLYAHATRRWAKKIRGRTHFFGPWSDPDAALDKYNREKEALHAGR